MIEILDSEMLRRAECDLISHLNLKMISTLLKPIHNCIAIYILFTRLEYFPAEKVQTAVETAKFKKCSKRKAMFDYVWN